MANLIELIAAIDNGKQDLVGRNDIVWELWGTVLNPGRVQIVLEGVSIEPSLDDLRVRAADLAPDGRLTVTFRFDSVRHELEEVALGAKALTATT